MDRAPLLVFSHIPWDSTFERPHQVMSRLTSRREVLFVEEPSYREGKPELEIQTVSPGLRIVRPHLSNAGPGFGPAQQRPLMTGLRDLLARDGWSEFVAWLYTPMAVRVARSLAPRRMIYDCLDEQPAFAVTPSEFAERERELLAHADVVFTGTPSRLKGKARAIRCVLCLPSAIEEKHFTGVKSTKDVPDQAGISRPRLGCLGVIDERVDLEIVDALAAARPDWQIVLAGHVAKASPASLPQRANLHYLGSPSYEELPRYLAGWDLCLAPFKVDETAPPTRLQKILEYMAADRPIVTTPIPDVAELYGEIVYLGEGSSGFVDACDRALAASPTERRARRTMARRVLARTSWDETAASMDQVLTGLLGRAPKLFAPNLVMPHGAPA
jgi:UDP-galactopyranose mutase